MMLSRLDPARITRLEACGTCTRIYQADDKPLLSSYSLSHLCRRFPHLLRVSKSSAIHPGYTTRTSPNWAVVAGAEVWLSDHYLRGLSAEQAARIA